MIFGACQWGCVLFGCTPVAEDKRERAVAQSGSAPAWGAGGRGFESRQPDHFVKFQVRKPEVPRKAATKPQRLLAG